MELNLFGNITKFSIKRRRVIYFALMFIMIYGVMSYKNLPKSINPEVKTPWIYIDTFMVGASSSDVDELITDKIEEAVKDISGIKEIRSTSSHGHSRIQIEFLESANILSKIQEIEKNINNISNKLPENSGKSIVREVEVNSFPTIVVDLSIDMPYKESKKVIEDLENRFKGVKGVTRVDIFGMSTPVIEITPNRKKMEQYGITEDVLVGAIQGKYFSMPLGEVEIRGTKYAIKADNQFSSIRELERLEVMKEGSKSIYLRTIAKVAYKEVATESKNFKVKNGIKKQIINMHIYKDKDADIIAINKNIKKIVEDYKQETKGNIPIDVSMDVSKFITKSLQDVASNAIGGAMVVIIILFLFINLREAIVAAIVIPVTVITTISLFPVVGLTINFFSIMGIIIALGMLVDNAIVVIEMIDEKRKKEKDEFSFYELVIFSTNNVAPAIFASTVTTVCGYIPLLFMAGFIGKIMVEMSLTTVMSIVISFVASITITPLLAYQLLKDEEIKKERSNKKIVAYLIFISIISLFAFSNNWKPGAPSIIAAIVFPVLIGIKFYQDKKNIKFHGYDRCISKLMKSKKRQIGAISLTVLFLISSFALFAFGVIKNEPTIIGDDQRLHGTIKLSIGSVYKESFKVFEKIDEHLSKEKDINEYTCVINDNTLTYTIQLFEKENRFRDGKDISADINKYIWSIAGLEGEIRPEASAEGGNNPIEIQLYGRNTEKLLEEAKRVKGILDEIPGTVNSKVEVELGLPTVNITFNEKRASELGLNLRDATMKIRNIISGKEIVEVKLNDENIDVKLKYDKPFTSLNDFRRIKLLNNRGVPVSISKMVSLDVGQGISQITRYDNKKVIVVSTGNDDSITTTEIMTEFEKKLKKSGGLSEGVTRKVGGQQQAMQDSYSDLAKKFVLSVMLVYCVLLIQFNSFLQPFAILLSVPFSIIGVAFGFAIFGIRFSEFAFMGIISLVGIAVNDAIVLIDYINNLRKNKGYERVEAIIEGCKSRFKPIVATSLTTITGVFPLALYSEYFTKIGFALIFGLVGSTFLTLFVIPIMLNILEGIKGKINSLIGGREKNNARVLRDIQKDS